MSESSRLKFLIRLADRKGILQGPLNALQEEALRWQLVEENEEQYEIEKERMKYTILAGNIHLWKELYKDEDEGDIDWITPKSAEDIENIINILNSTQQGQEDLRGDT